MAFLCHQGDRTDHVLVLVSGHVRVLGHTMDDREVVIGVRTAGDILGEIAAVDTQPRSATLQALDAVEVLTVPGSRFATLCRTQPTLAWALLGVVSARLRELGQQWLEFGGGSTTRRVVALLLELAVRHGVATANGIEIETPATQQELAATAATSRESFSRTLRELRERGLISTGRRRVVIHRMAELRSLAR
jgi:CRP-like cAMP-binding protein